MKKGQEAKKKSTPEELAEKFRVSVGHDVTRILEWNAKLRKHLGSKKYHLDDQDKDNIKAAVSTEYDVTMGAFEAKTAPEKPVFRL